MKKLIVVFIVALYLGCASKVDYTPHKVNYERDVCVQCLMGIAEQKYAVQAINNFGEIVWFDDVGCLIEYMKSDDWKKFKGEKVKVWISEADTGEWIDAFSAYYRYGDKTPMGYGYGALKEKKGEVYTFDELVKRVEAGKTSRESFIKEHKMMKHK